MLPARWYIHIASAVRKLSASGTLVFGRGLVRLRNIYILCAKRLQLRRACLPEQVMARAFFFSRHRYFPRFVFLHEYIMPLLRDKLLSEIEKIRLECWWFTLYFVE